MNRSHPYISLPPASHWRSASTRWAQGELGGLYEPRFEIDRGTAVATAGSCFAQHIGNQLRARGYKFIDLEPAPKTLLPEVRKAFGYELFSARYGNIYTSRQLRQLVDRAYGSYAPEAIWEEEGRFYDAFRPTIEPGGFGSRDELMHLRNWHLRQVRKMFAKADIFVFTLGLTELWFNRTDKVAYPLCPGTAVGRFDAAQHEFVNLSYSDVLEDMEVVVARLRERNPSLRFLLTVSPVPLAATATGKHVVAATTYSKSVLRAVAGALSDKHDFVDYFPSFEIVTSHLSRGLHYAQNMRNVTAEGVAAVMDCFFNGEAAPAVDLVREQPDPEDEKMIRDVHVICDEEALDQSEAS